MAKSSSRVRIKIGIIEIEYEGESAFLEDGLEELLNSVVELSKGSGLNQISHAVSLPPQEDAITTSFQSAASPNVRSTDKEFTTSMLASHSSANNAVDLALCAMAFLELRKGAKPNDRSAILTEMKTVSSIYNATMAKNNAANLKSLAKSKRINDLGSNRYALAKDELARFESIVAQFD